MNKLLFLTPVIQHNVWGGTRLIKEYGYKAEGNNLGECWGISAHHSGDCHIVNPEYRDMTLSELYKQHPDLFGNPNSEVFPILVKIIDANQDLSIQVHPDDDYARIHENYLNGKTECWYIIDCPPGAELIVGHNASTREELKMMIHNKEWDKLIRRISVKQGDFIAIEPGTVHSITAGCLILEIQQSCDITYRLYDYNRLYDGKLRDLHIDKSIDVIEVPARPIEKSMLHTLDKADCVELLRENQCFKVWKLRCNEKVSFDYNEKYLNVSVIEGSGIFNGEEVHKGDHFIVSNGCTKLKIKGDLAAIMSAPVCM